jgi:hypothetical protein
MQSTVNPERMSGTAKFTRVCMLRMHGGLPPTSCAGCHAMALLLSTSATLYYYDTLHMLPSAVFFSW